MLNFQAPKTLRTVSFFLLFVAIASCGLKPESESRVTIQSGVTDFNSPAVAQIEGIAGERFGFCTGTWIAPNAILTADHCLRGNVETIFYPEGGEHDGIPQSGRVELVTPTKRQCADLLPKNLEDCLAQNYFDVGVVIFGKKLAPATAPLLETPPNVGESFSILGLGATNCESGTERVLWTGRKPGRLEVLVGAPLLVRAVTRFASFVEGAQARPCPGDSGGPFLDRKTGGVFAVTGLVANMADKSTRVYGTTLSAVSNELREIIRRNQLLVRYVGSSNIPSPSPGVPGAGSASQDATLATFVSQDGGTFEIVLPRGASIASNGVLKILAKSGPTPSQFQVFRSTNDGWEKISDGFFNLTKRAASLDLSKIGAGQATLRVDIVEKAKVIASTQVSVTL